MNMVLDRPTPRHCWDCYFCMCHQLALSGTPARSLDLRSPLFLTMCSCALWDCQTLLRNWVVIKVVLIKGEDNQYHLDRILDNSIAITHLCWSFRNRYILEVTLNSPRVVL
jgi:hypothetical protein